MKSQVLTSSFLGGASATRKAAACSAHMGPAASQSPSQQLFWEVVSKEGPHPPLSRKDL